MSGSVPQKCEGTRKGKTCGGPLFKCDNPECGSTGCERKSCDNRQFHPIQKCKDCGRAYERIQLFEVAKGVNAGGNMDNHGDKPSGLPRTEVMFGGALVLAALLAAMFALAGNFPGNFGGGSRSDPAATTPSIEASAGPTLASGGYTEICQCYRDGMELAGRGVSVLDSKYRVGFVQCRASFGTQGGEAWTAGWNAREQGRIVGAGCRSWQRGFGR